MSTPASYSPPPPPYPDHTVPTPPSGAVTEKPRPGRLLPTLALVLAIAGFIVVSLGFFAFLPEVGRVLGIASFSGWAFLVAALVLSIIALVRKAVATGMSVAALIVSIVGGFVGIVATILVVVVGAVGYATSMIDEYSDLLPDDLGGNWSPSEGSMDPDVQADCALLIAVGPEQTGTSESVRELFDTLADEMITAEVGEPLDDLADAYDELMDANTPGDAASATAEVRRAADELGDVCGFGLAGLP